MHNMDKNVCTLFCYLIWCCVLREQLCHKSSYTAKTWIQFILHSSWNWRGKLWLLNCTGAKWMCASVSVCLWAIAMRVYVCGRKLNVLICTKGIHWLWRRLYVKSDDEDYRLRQRQQFRRRQKQKLILAKNQKALDCNRCKRQRS